MSRIIKKYKQAFLLVMGIIIALLITVSNPGFATPF